MLGVSAITIKQLLRFGKSAIGSMSVTTTPALVHSMLVYIAPKDGALATVARCSGVRWCQCKASTENLSLFYYYAIDF